MLNRIMDQLSTVSALRALSHEHRLAAYRALVQAGPVGLAVGELRDVLGLAPATLTAHLNILRSAGLVGDEREGRVIRVRADFERMHALIGFLTENCCAGASCAPSRNQPVRTARRAAMKSAIPKPGARA